MVAARPLCFLRRITCFSSCSRTPPTHVILTATPPSPPPSLSSAGLPGPIARLTHRHAAMYPRL